MADFFGLKVLDKRQETEDTVSLSFYIPEELKSEFTYKSGQYINVKVNISGTEFIRSYSICSSPNVDDEFRIAVKKVDGGVVSNYLNDSLNSCEAIEISKPEGKFTAEVNDSASRPVIFFAGGSGITPIFSHVKSFLAGEPVTNVYLFYSNKNKNNIIFESEIQELLDQYGGRFFVNHLISRTEQKSGFLGGLFKSKKQEENVFGRLSADKAKDLVKDVAGFKNAQVFVCGPNGMMEAAIDGAKQAGLNADQIHSEYFVAPGQEKKNTEAISTLKGSDKAITVVLDGEEHIVKVKSTQTILDAVLKAGIDAPYSCRGAVCSTCMAKIESGKASMDMNYVLSDSEIEQGFVVTCQAHPITNDVKVNYDEAN